MKSNAAAHRSSVNEADDRALAPARLKLEGVEIARLPLYNQDDDEASPPEYATREFLEKFVDRFAAWVERVVPSGRQ